jgi:hypothetical protein
MNIWRDTPNLVNVRKISSASHEDLTRPYCCRSNNFAMKAVYVQHSICLCYSSAIHTEHIVAVPFGTAITPTGHKFTL